jgi:hypothetical protein
MKYCYSCKNLIEISNIKFCPYCGEKKTRNFDIKDFIPQEGIVIVFKYQAKKIFQNLYDKTKESIEISEIGEGKIKFCFVSSPIKEAYKLFDVLGQLLYKNDYFIFENGKKLRSTNDIFATRVCCAQRSVHETPEYYCFGINAPNGDLTPNLVGCLHTGLDISPYSSLYRSGEWLDIFGNYVFDKEKIASKANTMVRKYRFCPFLNEKIVQKFVELWAEQINVHLDKSWEAWPPKNDSFSEGLKELGLISNTNMQKNYVPEFPVATDTKYFIDLAKKLYSDETPANIQDAIYASINTIQMNIFKEYS